MRPLYIYLAVYVALLVGALLVLAQSGILRQIPAIWTVLAVLAAVGLGLVLALASRPPAPPPPDSIR